MELNDLKKTWEKLSSEKALGDNRLKEMLRKKTGNQIDRIDRNIRVGFGILLLLIIIFILDDLVYAPRLVKQMGTEVQIPGWLVFVSILAYSLIFITFVYFVIHYYKVKKSCNISSNLKETLVKTITTLRIYQRLFYLALIFLSVSLALQFVSGIYLGLDEMLKDGEILMTDISFDKWLLVTGLSLVVLFLTVGGVFLFMRWGFRKLYGNYISKLKQNLNELNEIDN